MKSLVVRGAILATIALAVLVPVSAFGLQDTVTKSFQVSPGGELRLSTDNGSIEVRTGSTNRVDVEIVRKSRTSDSTRFQKMVDEYSFDLSQSGDDVIVDVKSDRRGRRWFDWRDSLQLEFHVTVPSVYNLDLDTSGGSIEVSDLNGRVEANTSGGSLRFGRVTGEVSARTSGGSVSLEETGGSVDVRTSGGSITLGRVEGDVRAETSGGSIQVDEVFGVIDASTSGGSVHARISSQPRANCSLSTSGGTVNVELSSGVSVDLDASTSSGRVVSDFDVQGSVAHDKSWMRGSINGGGPRLTLRSSGGNIYVKER